MERLGDIAEFGATVSFREAVKAEPGGNIGIVQSKDVGVGTLDTSGIVHVQALPMRGAPPRLRSGDILLQSRGASYRSAIVPEGIEAAVAASSLFVMRTDAALVDPRFLVLFFNLPATQAVLRKIATGTHILNIRREELANLAVPLPPLRDQRSLVELGRLINRSNELEQQRHHLRLQELDALIKVRANIPCRLG